MSARLRSPWETLTSKPLGAEAAEKAGGEVL